MHLIFQNVSGKDFRNSGYAALVVQCPVSTNKPILPTHPQTRAK